MAYLPTNSSSFSEARGRCFFQMSMVKSVELLLKIEVSDDIRAAIMTAIISPRRPVINIQMNWAGDTFRSKICYRYLKWEHYSHRLAWVQSPVWERQCWSIPPQLHTPAHTLLDPHILQSLKHEAVTGRSHTGEEDVTTYSTHAQFMFCNFYSWSCVVYFILKKQ